jgi:hypothetical protein
LRLPLIAVVVTVLTVPFPAAAGEGELREDPCRAAADPDAARLDRLRYGMEVSVCATSRWFDGLFGDPRENAEVYANTHGRIGLGVNWDERDQLTVNGRFRARFVLPTLGERFNLIAGRDSQENFIDDSYDDISFLPGRFSDDRDAQWFAGVSYVADASDRSLFDVSAGVQLQSPLNPYLKARYRYFIQPSSHLLLTLRSTTFWENDDGLGLTLAADADRALDDRRVLRLANTATFAEATEGVRWRTRLLLYEMLDARSAIRYEAAVKGQTDGTNPDYYGLRVTYRRSAWRDWFFLEYTSNLFWSDGTAPRQRCDACLGVGVGFEIMFGDRYDGRQRATPLSGE